MGAKIRIIQEQTHDFRGKYPANVPISPEVSLEELTAYDRENGQKPFFVILPLGETDQVSRNQRRYVGETATNAIYKAIMEQRIGGRRGHTPAGEHANYFGYEVLDWVGAVVQDGVVWGKAYVPGDTESGREMRSYYRRAKAKNAAVGTSIEGNGYQEWDAEAEMWNISELDVEYIDAVPAKRVGVLMAGGNAPIITAETLADEPDAGAPDEPTHENTPPIIDEEDAMAGNPNELTTTESVDVDARLHEMGERHKEEVRELQGRIRTLESKAKDFDALAEEIGGEDDPVLRVRALKSELTEALQENRDLLEATITEAVREAVKVETLRPTIFELVKAEQPARKVDVAAKLAKVLARDYVKTLLRTQMQQEMGPNVEPGIENNNHTDEPNAWFVFPTEA